jgi:tetratricopeptide (TPR) repeat protein
LLLGKSHLRLGDQKKAEYFFKNALKISPNFAPALDELSLLYGNQKKYLQCIRYSKKFIRHCGQETLWEHLVLLALMYIEIKKPSGAERILDRLIKIYDRYPGIVPEETYKKVRLILRTFLMPKRWEQPKT